MPTNYYQSIIDILREPLGPAAERFLNRQMEFHLGKKTSHLTATNVKKITPSISTALSLLTSDKKSIVQTEKKILSLLKADVIE